MIELLPDAIGIGELRLIMPTLARITLSERHVAMISPPFIPFAPALLQQGLRLDHVLIVRAEKAVDVLWACEQALRCQSFGAVIAWPVTIKDREIRRLQLAAEAGHSLGFLYRTPAAATEASPAAMRLRLQPGENGDLHIDILKCRGIRSGLSVRMPAPTASDSGPLPVASGQ
jgi:cell division inhibitor SulA